MLCIIVPQLTLKSVEAATNKSGPAKLPRAMRLPVALSQTYLRRVIWVNENIFTHADNRISNRLYKNSRRIQSKHKSSIYHI